MNALLVVIAVTVITLSPAVVTFIVSTVAPWVVAALTHIDAPPRMKRLVGAFVAVLVGFVVNRTVADGSAVFSIQAAVLAVLAFVVQQVSYSGLWKRLNLNRWRWLLPAFGLYKPSAPPS